MQEVSGSIPLTSTKRIQGPLRLEAQDTTLSRSVQRFESARGRHTRSARFGIAGGLFCYSGLGLENTLERSAVSLRSFENFCEAIKNRPDVESGGLQGKMPSVLGLNGRGACHSRP